MKGTVPCVNARPRAIAILVFVTLLWGISFPVMTMTNLLMAARVQQAGADASLSDGVAASSANVAQLASASFYVALRFAVATALLAGCVPRLFRGISAAQWGMGLCVGFCFAAGFLMQVLGLNTIAASRSGFLTSMAVVFTPILMMAIERRFPRWPVVAGAAVALIGTAVLTGIWRAGVGLRPAPVAIGGIVIGDVLTLVASGLFAVQIILIDSFSRRMPPERLTPGMFIGAVLAGLATFVTVALDQPRFGVAAHGPLFGDLPFMTLTALTSLLCTVLAFHLMNVYQAQVSPAHAALIYTLEPIFATLWAMLLPDLISPQIGISYRSERLGLPLVAGGSLILIGNLLALCRGPSSGGVESPARGT